MNIYVVVLQLGIYLNILYRSSLTFALLSSLHLPDKIFLFSIYSLTGRIEKSETEGRIFIVVLHDELFLYRLFGMKGKQYGLFIGVGQREVFLQGIGGEVLTHTRAIEHTTRAMVDEGSPVDASLIGKAQHRVDTLFFE